MHNQWVSSRRSASELASRSDFEVKFGVVSKRVEAWEFHLKKKRLYFTRCKQQKQNAAREFNKVFDSVDAGNLLHYHASKQLDFIGKQLS